ncbi:MAG: hypothetical protein IMW89_19150 [Ktedonobacteraceae bacterium]|nr:hypothetical protein [Ktedonobacteraceae bacterium]
MKIVRRERLIDEGVFSSTAMWAKIEHDVIQAIATIEWPPNSGSFTIYPQSGKKKGEGNGVKPIKDAFILHLEARGWVKEQPLTVLGTGEMDIAYWTDKGLFCVEWETGNVSSSHRSLNKMTMGMIEKVLIGGILVVPTRALATFLTDRIGNFPELSAYFPFWRKQKVHIQEGVLEIIAVEHDATSFDVPRISKGTDGRALT